MNIFLLPVKVIRYFRKTKFIRDFKYCARSSGFEGNCTFIGKENIFIGENTYIGPGCEIYAYNSHFQKQLCSELVIGNNVRFTSRCRITCAGKIILGNDVLVAPDVFITDHNHGTRPDSPGGYSKQPLTIKEVCVEDGVWLGQRVCVLPGVKIGKHSIIGANSVVTHDVPEYCMAVGAPAKVIKRWNMEKQEWERI